MEHLIPLTLLHRGQVAHVEQVLGNTSLLHRLAELGLQKGTRVEMVQPGSPCIVKLDGQRLCLRTEDLGSVLVIPGAIT